MTTAVLEQDAIVSQPAREVVYSARRTHCRLVWTARQPVFGPNGMQQGQLPGISVQFREGLLRVPLEGEVRTEQGMKVNAAELNAWLQDHPMFGDIYEGFFKVEQVAPPISSAELDVLMTAAARLDADALEAIVEQERGGWNRQDLLAPAERHLAQVRALNEQQALVAAEKAAAEKAKK